MTAPAATETLAPPGPTGPWPGALPRTLRGPVTFVGRKREIAELRRLIPKHPLVTLNGPAGIGKTSLAVEVANRLSRRFEDGIWVADLGSVTEPHLVAQVVASSRGLPVEPGRDPIDSLVAHLQGRRALLVLDNCEHLIDACAALCDRLITEAGLPVLATSQRPLGLEVEYVVPLQPLSLPTGGVAAADIALGSEAVALFCARAADRSPMGFQLTDDMVPAVVEICVRLDGIPLAIELAAARAGVLTPAEIAERLADRFRLLTGGAVDAPPRHQTLRAALDWSHDLLGPPQTALLRRLSVFSGGATLRAIEVVCPGGDVEGPDIVDALTELIERSLVVADTVSGPRSRYFMLESVREYGLERLEAAGELETYRGRHAAWCTKMAEGVWHSVTFGDQSSIDELAAEVGNVRAALGWATAGPKPEVGLRLAAAMTPFWKLRGDFREGQMWLERAADASPEANVGLRARGLWGLSMLAILQGDVAAATAAIQESLALARTAKLARAEAQALNMLGFISLFAQDPLAAMPLLEESVALARSLSDVDVLGNALAMYGRSHLFVGDAESARRVFEECLELDDEEGDGPSASSLIGLGWTAVLSGHHRRAEEHFRRALPLVRAADERFETALVLSFLGELAQERGEHDVARSVLVEGLAMAESMGAPFPLVRCLTGLARVSLSVVDADEALRLIDQACTKARSARLPYALVRALNVQGIVRLAADDRDGSRLSFNDALATARDNCDASGIAVSLQNLARLARHRDNAERAASLHTEALTFLVRIPDEAGIATSLESLAGLAAEQGRYEQGVRLLGAAEALREATGAPRPPEQAAEYRTDSSRLHEYLERAAFDQAWAEGAALSRPEAVALATKGRGSRDRPSDGWDSLTPAERQVVELAASGLTNAEIGEKLFVSGRTVQGHLLRVFPKLGIRSRRQLREVETQP